MLDMWNLSQRHCDEHLSAALVSSRLRWSAARREQPTQGLPPPGGLSRGILARAEGVSKSTCEAIPVGWAVKDRAEEFGRQPAVCVGPRLDAGWPAGWGAGWSRCAQA